METLIRPVRTGDSGRLAEIYAPSVRDSVTSFESEPPDSREMAARIQRVTKRHPWLVAEDETSRVIGYVYATDWRERSAYSKTCEAAIYVDPTAARRGVGRALMKALAPKLSQRGFHQLIAGVALPNDGSEALLVSLGFQRVGVFREVGYKHDRWVDVGFWQLAL